MAKKDKSSLGLENLCGFTRGDDKREYTLIPTGYSELDYRISRGLLEDEGITITNRESGGGIPLGTLGMLYGEEGGGKSTLAYKMCGHAQRLGFSCAWMDIENSLSPSLAKIHDCDFNQLYKYEIGRNSSSETDYSAEAILDAAMDVCQSGKINLLIVDSVAALIPKYVLDNPTEKDTVSLLARILAKSMPKLTCYAAANNATVIFINQLRVNPGKMFGNPEGTTGGHAIKHLCSLVLKVTKKKSKESNINIDLDNGEEELIGMHSYVHIEKNRFARPFKENLEIPIYFKHYKLSPDDQLFMTGRELQLITARKGVFSWRDVKIEGKENFLKALNDAGRMAEFLIEIKCAALEAGKILSADVINYKVVATAVDTETVEVKKAPKKPALTQVVPLVNSDL